VHDVVVGVAFVDRDMDHQPVGGSPVPVLLVGLEQHPVAGSDDLDGTTAPLAQADSLGDEDGLPQGWRCQWVRAPGMKCTRFAVTRDGGGWPP
jgi:hypothetical protein